MWLLVQCSTAVLCSTQARNLVLLEGELVVVGDFFIDSDGLLGVDHDLLLGLDGDDLGVTIWLQTQTNKRRMSKSRSDVAQNVRAGAFTHSAAVVDESRQVATLGGIYDGVVVHSEQVAAPDALLCVALLAIVGHHLDTRSTSMWCMRAGSRLLRKQLHRRAAVPV